MIALAEGTDLGGSLRIPAAFCGVTGLRPSVGLVPTHPTDWVWDTLQVTGPMARTAEDVALMLQTISGAAEQSPFAQPIDGRDFVRGAREARKNVRMAYCSDIAGIGVDPGVERVCREAAFALAGKGAIVEEVQLDLSAARPAFLSLRGLWFVTHMFSRPRYAERFGPNVGITFAPELAVTSAEIAAAEVYRGHLWHQFRKFSTNTIPAHAMCCVPPFQSSRTIPIRLPARRCRPTSTGLRRRSC